MNQQWINAKHYLDDRAKLVIIPRRSMWEEQTGQLFSKMNAGEIEPYLFFDYARKALERRLGLPGLCVLGGGFNLSRGRLEILIAHPSFDQVEAYNTISAIRLDGSKHEEQFVEEISEADFIASHRDKAGVADHN